MSLYGSRYISRSVQKTRFVYNVLLQSQIQKPKLWKKLYENSTTLYKISAKISKLIFFSKFHTSEKILFNSEGKTYILSNLILKFEVISDIICSHICIVYYELQFLNNGFNLVHF